MGNRHSNLTGNLTVRIVVLQSDIHVRLSGSGILNGLSRNFFRRRIDLLTPDQDVINGPSVEQYSFDTIFTIESEQVEQSSDYETSNSDSEVGEN